jgi:Domain of unknown function (DUF5655)
MAKDEQEEEGEFLAGLKTRTGRDLAEWMAAITAQGFMDKNETIDWLREQGLPFARASWLERIHKNGGKPIYSHAPPKEGEQRAAPAAPVLPPRLKPRAAPTPAPTPAPAPAAAPAPADADALEKILAAAKGYRPLYHLLETEMRGAIPNLKVAAGSGYVSLSAPAEFAALTPHATELRLGFALGERPFDGVLLKSKLKGPGSSITHMVVLTDARQVNDELLSLLKAANRRVNG